MATATATETTPPIPPGGRAGSTNADLLELSRPELTSADRTRRRLERRREEEQNLANRNKLREQLDSMQEEFGPNEPISLAKRALLVHEKDEHTSGYKSQTETKDWVAEDRIDKAGDVDELRDNFIEKRLIVSGADASFDTAALLADSLTKEDYFAVFDKFKAKLDASLSAGTYIDPKQRAWAQKWVKMIQDRGHLTAYDIATSKIPEQYIEPGKFKDILKRIQYGRLAKNVTFGLVKGVAMMPVNISKSTWEFARNPKAYVGDKIEMIKDKVDDGGKSFKLGLVVGGTFVVADVLTGGASRPIRAGAMAALSLGTAIGMHARATRDERSILEKFHLQKKAAGINERDIQAAGQEYQRRLYELRTRHHKVEKAVRNFALGASITGMGLNAERFVFDGGIDVLSHSIQSASSLIPQRTDSFPINGISMQKMTAGAENLGKKAPDLPQDFDEEPLRPDLRNIPENAKKMLAKDIDALGNVDLTSNPLVAGAGQKMEELGVGNAIKEGLNRVGVQVGNPNLGDETQAIADSVHNAYQDGLNARRNLAQQAARALDGARVNDDIQTNPGFVQQGMMPTKQDIAAHVQEAGVSALSQEALERAKQITELAGKAAPIIEEQPVVKSLIAKSVDAQKDAALGALNQSLAQQGVDVTTFLEPSNPDYLANLTQYNELANKTREKMALAAQEQFRKSLDKGLDDLSTNNPALFAELQSKDANGLKTLMSELVRAQNLYEQFKADPNSVSIADKLFLFRMRGYQALGNVLDSVQNDYSTNFSTLSSSDSFKNDLAQIAAQVKGSSSAASAVASAAVPVIPTPQPSPVSPTIPTPGSLSVAPPSSPDVAAAFTTPPTPAVTPILQATATTLNLPDVDARYSPETTENMLKLGRVLNKSVDTLAAQPEVQTALHTSIAEQANSINQIVVSTINQSGYRAPSEADYNQVYSEVYAQFEQSVGEKFKERLNKAVVDQISSDQTLAAELVGKSPAEIEVWINSPANYDKLRSIAMLVSTDSQDLVSEALKDPKLQRSVLSVAKGGLDTVDRLADDYVAYPNKLETGELVAPTIDQQVIDAGSDTALQLAKELYPPVHNFATEMGKDPELNELWHNTKISSFARTANEVGYFGLKDVGVDTANFTQQDYEDFMGLVMVESGIDLSKYAGTPLEAAVVDLLSTDPQSLNAIGEMTPAEFTKRLEDYLNGTPDAQIEPFALKFMKLYSAAYYTPEARNDLVKLIHTGTRLGRNVLNNLESNIPVDAQPEISAPSTQGLPDITPPAIPASPDQTGGVVIPPVVEEAPSTAAEPSGLPAGVTPQPSSAPTSPISAPPPQGEEAVEGVTSATEATAALTPAQELGLSPEVSDQLMIKEVMVPSGSTVSNILNENGYPISWNLDEDPEVYSQTAEAFKQTLKLNWNDLNQMWEQMRESGNPRTQGPFPLNKNEIDQVVEDMKNGDIIARGRVVEALHWIPADKPLKIVTKQSFDLLTRKS